MKSKYGKIYLVGAGPGDPELLTLRGRAMLRQADVVVMDALVNPKLVRGLKAKIIFAGKRGFAEKHRAGLAAGPSQEVINKLLVRLGRRGLRVVRLKGGDPFVFGRGSEEVAALQSAGIPYEVVPGISSAIAVPAAVGIPVTDRRWASQVTLITGHGQLGKRGGDRFAPGVDWKRISPNGTLIVLMGVASWKKIRPKLLAAGWPPSKPVVAVQSGTTPYQRVVRTTLFRSSADFAAQDLMAPAVSVVGDVARLARRPRIVVTRPDDQSADLIAMLKSRDADIIRAPAIKIRPLTMRKRLRRVHYDWILFLSANAVRTFHAKPHRFATTSVLAVGPETRRVAKEAGWPVHQMPARFDSSGVLAALRSVRGQSILIPRVQNAPKDLPLALRRRGAIVEEVVTYETRPARLSASIKREILRGVDAVTFTSTSTVAGFCSNFSSRERKEIFAHAIAVSIGRQTTATLRKYGVRRINEAKNATMADLLTAAKV